MTEEANHNRYKAYRAGHRGALTRLTKEIDEVLESKTLNEEHRHKLNIVHQQLEVKAKVLTELDNDVMKCCELGEIEREVQEADVIAAKIIEYKAKLESVMRPANNTDPTRIILDPSETSSTVTRPHLSKLTLPHLRMTLPAGHHSGILMTLLYTVTLNFQLWISSTTCTVCWKALPLVQSRGLLSLKLIMNQQLIF